MHISSLFIVAVGLLACASIARADAVGPPPPTCPPGGRPTTCHVAGGHCAVDTCTSDGDCGTGQHCGPAPLCIRVVTCGGLGGSSPDDDVTGVCPTGTCASGTCMTRTVCTSGAPVDAGTDSGTGADAGTGSDAGGGADAGSGTDAGTGTDAGGGADAGGARDAGADAGGGSTASGGCCSTAGARGAAGGALLVAAGVALVLARRRS